MLGLLPFTYLEGKALHDWDKRIWAAAYFVAAVAFVFIAVPLGGDWEESKEPLGTWLLIISGFALIALAAWSVFRFLPQPDHERAHADSPTVPIEPRSRFDFAGSRGTFLVTRITGDAQLLV